MDETGNHRDPAKSADPPLPDSKAIPKHDAPDAEQASSKAETKESESFDLAMLRWTRVVAVFTAVLAIVGSIQAWAFIQSERAAVYVQIDGITPLPIIADKPFSVQTGFVNTGRGQAFISAGQINVWIGKSLPEKPHFVGDQFGPKGAIPAQGKRFSSMPLNQPLNWAQVDAIARGDLKLYIFGFAKYTDDFSIFGGEHTVGFCGVYNPRGYNPPSTPGAPIDDCDNPNYTYYN